MSGSSEVRNFRYVGTLTACHVATCLVKTVVNLADERETAKGQEEAERRKKGNKARHCIDEISAETGLERL